MDQREKLNEHEENNIKEKDKVNLFELLGFLGNIFTVLTFLSLDYATAKYRGKGTMYTVAYIVIIIMSVFWIFRVLQLMYHSKIVQKLRDFLYGKINNIERREKNQRSIKWGECHQKLKIILLLGFIIVIAVTVHLCVPKTEYYSAVTEVYGIPRGIGAPLSS